MKVSVIIPAYNEEKYISKVLESLMNQTVRPDEIIVVDNNCQDKTAAIAKKFGATVITEKKQGITPARNKGFDSAKFEILARCDADVILPKDWIAKIIKDFKKGDIDALSGPVIYYDSVLKHVSTVPSRVYLEALRFSTGGNRCLIGMNMILTQKIWKKVKKYVTLEDSRVHEDVDISLKILKVGGKIGYDNSLVVKASSRRMVSKPGSFFLEYPIRMLKTFLANRPSN